ncbi:peptidase T. Metallo peptidase. MEROPS family M20B [Clostridium collagenovorans DSM 3089]|uniref:Peptidase T n=1 Tax=Clostridium collagenovorans DSM 3089 TaxID=1121306 RepID=A0A1M5VYI9_9CLOT|nr:peptidase T [Clostridium collagenovorans]SHH80352.1 peptidase T. Metallo peptidase. MEROPS family M20B [Clostridium collagenovorans DSM 3089]
MSTVIERFLKYVSYDTKSDTTTGTNPSTMKQFDLAKELVAELNELGLKNVSVDDKAYVMAELPANTDKEIPTIGFIAHMDTTPEMSGANVKPQIVTNYDGKDIVLNKEKNVVLQVKDFPEIKEYVGKTLITTDGTTVLGADDKAGIAEIMSAIEFLVKNPEIKHGTIKIGFTPDEEIGEGADHFDVEKFGAEFAYTVDGGEIGEFEFENFNAAAFKLVINGRNVHPGSAKNKMINSQLLGLEFVSMLPENERPETTEGYEGFYLLDTIEGNVERTEMHFIIRDFFKDGYEARKQFVVDLVKKLNEKYGEGTFELELKDQYQNMREMVEPIAHIIESATKAMELVGVTPKVRPIRGGTDGARLSFMGLPTPNLFTGGHNFHGKFEYIPTYAMEKAVEVIIKIVEIYSEK